MRWNPLTFKRQPTVCSDYQLGDQNGDLMTARQLIASRCNVMWIHMFHIWCLPHSGFPIRIRVCCYSYDRWMSLTTTTQKNWYSAVVVWFLQILYRQIEEKISFRCRPTQSVWISSIFVLMPSSYIYFSCDLAKLFGHCDDSLWKGAWFSLYGCWTNDDMNAETVWIKLRMWWYQTSCFTLTSKLLPRLRQIVRATHTMMR